MSKKKIILIVLAILILLGLGGVIAGLSLYAYNLGTKTTTQEVAIIVEKTSKTITRTDSTLDAGVISVENEGKNGSIEIIYKLTFKGNKLASKKKIKETTIRKPVDRVIHIGIKDTKGTKIAKPYPATQKDLITSYYQAINDHEWETAWSYVTDDFKTGFDVTNPPPELAAYSGIERFQHSYEDYVSSVSVTNTNHQTSYPDPYVYVVSFDATYIQEYPARTGKLPAVHYLIQDPTTSEWKINEIGTG